MTDTLIDRRDLAFQLYEVLDTESLSERERFSEHSRDTFDAVIETADKIARDKFATHNSAADKDEPKFVDGQVEMLPQVKEAFDAYADAGFIAGRYDYELGGMQLPESVMAACNGFFTAANPGTAGYPFPHHRCRQPDPRVSATTSRKAPSCHTCSAAASPAQWL